MKQAVFAWGNNFEITDAQNRPVYQVKGEVFSWGDKLSFQNASGAELAFIAQRVFSWGKAYEVHVGGVLFAEILKEFTFFSDKYTVDVPGPNDYVVEGDFWDHEYSFLRGGRVVAQVSKAFFSWGDTYGIEMSSGSEDLPVLATAVVIDLVNQAERRRR